MRAGPRTKDLAALIEVAKFMEGPRTQYRLDAYLINMALRLVAMRHVLKPTGSIYLHCDPTASHYLKVIMDIVFGKGNFRNEVSWCYRKWATEAGQYARNHDTILFYSKSNASTFNVQHVPVSAGTQKRWKGRKQQAVFVDGVRQATSTDEDASTACPDWWDIPIINPNANERLRYPTQKPLKLLERIIRASSDRGDLILDPFCGCGTATHAAEMLGRRWVGIDISSFSTELIRNRMMAQCKVPSSDINILGVPVTPADARALAQRDKFEFEKWACGHVGAEGLFHAPGSKGPDRGVDGVLKFFPMHWNEKPKAHYAIVQVKGGSVTPDSVGRLYDTVEQCKATAGVIICFRNQLRTVENNRNRRTFSDVAGEYPLIQGLAVEDMLAGQSPALPNLLQKAA